MFFPFLYSSLEGSIYFSKCPKPPGQRCEWPHLWPLAAEMYLNEFRQRQAAPSSAKVMDAFKLSIRIQLRVSSPACSIFACSARRPRRRTEVAETMNPVKSRRREKRADIQNPASQYPPVSSIRR